jgi:hypothetical protein
MKQRMAGLMAGAIFGSVLGFGLGLATFPKLFPVLMSAGSAAAPMGAVLAEGRFVQADPKDPIHYGAGTLAVSQTRLELGADFEVGPGPGYRLWLTPLAEVGPDTRVDESMFVDLGPLQGFAGTQGYAIPTGVDLGLYPTVVVWSTHFNVLISSAALRPVARAR